MPELKPSTATVYKLAASISGVIKIRVEADFEIDILIIDKKNSEYFLKNGEFIKNGTIYHRFKERLLDKVFDVGLEEKHLILINLGSNDINYSIIIEEIFINRQTSQAITNVSGYFATTSSSS